MAVVVVAGAVETMEGLQRGISLSFNEFMNVSSVK